MDVILAPAPMAAVSDEPIQRLIRRFDRLDAALIGSVVAMGAVVCLGFIELLRSPLQQLARVTLEVLAVRAMLWPRFWSVRCC